MVEKDEEDTKKGGAPQCTSRRVFERGQILGARGKTGGSAIMG
jgi:hypothetical protein